MIARFYFTSGTYTDSDIIKASYNLTECFYNELSPADNSLKFNVPFSVVMANALKLHVNDKVRVEIIDGADTLFTGYVRQKVGFSKSVRNESISIEVVSPSFLLNKKSSASYVLTGQSVDTCLRGVLAQAGWTDIDPELPEIEDTIPVFLVNEGDNYREVITELLFEYGYTFDFDAYGYFVLYPLFESVPDVLPELSDGDTGNLFTSVSIQANERRYDGIAASWRDCVSGSELIFQDLSEHVAGDQIFDGAWYASYSAPKDIIYISSVTSDITKTPSNMSATVENEGLRAKITFSSASNPRVTKIALTGSGYFSTASNVTKVTDGENLKNHTIKYCFDGEKIEALCQKVRDYYKFSGMTVQFTTDEELALGSFVSVYAEGQGTIVARITRRMKSLVGMTQYEAESVTTYTPSEATTEKTSSLYASGEAAAIIEQAQTLIHGVRVISSLEESGAYEDEIANYHGQMYAWKDGAWHLINRERYLGALGHCPDFEENSYFLATEDFADSNGTSLTVDSTELEVDDTVLAVAASFNKGSIYVGENGSWN